MFFRGWLFECLARLQQAKPETVALGLTRLPRQNPCNCDLVCPTAVFHSFASHVDCVSNTFCYMLLRFGLILSTASVLALLQEQPCFVIFETIWLDHKTRPGSTSQTAWFSFSHLIYLRQKDLPTVPHFHSCTPSQ